MAPEQQFASPKTITMSSTKLGFVVIEDEQAIRKALVNRLNDIDQIEVVGEGISVESGIKVIRDQQPDCVFLDIRLKGGDAFQLISKLLLLHIPIPPIVLNTGHDEFEYAQRTFHDYGEYVIKIWLKPFYENWEDKIDEVIDLINIRKSISREFNYNDKYVVKSKDEIILVPYNEIKYIEASGDISKSRKSLIITYGNQEYLINKTLREVLSDLQSQGFLQINRNTIVNTQHITRFKPQEQMLYLERHSKGFPVGNAYIGNLKSFFAKI